MLLKAQFAHLYFCVTSQVDPRRHLSAMDKTQQLVPVVPHGASFRQVAAGTSAAAVAAYQYQPATSSSSSRPRLDHVPYCNSSSNLRDMSLVSISAYRIRTHTRTPLPPPKKKKKKYNNSYFQSVRDHGLMHGRQTVVGMVGDLEALYPFGCRLWVEEVMGPAHPASKGATGSPATGKWAHFVEQHGADYPLHGLMSKILPLEVVQSLPGREITLLWSQLQVRYQLVTRLHFFLAILDHCGQGYGQDGPSANQGLRDTIELVTNLLSHHYQSDAVLLHVNARLKALLQVSTTMQQRLAAVASGRPRSIVSDEGSRNPHGSIKSAGEPAANNPHGSIAADPHHSAAIPGADSGVVEDFRDTACSNAPGEEDFELDITDIQCKAIPAGEHYLPTLQRFVVKEYSAYDLVNRCMVVESIAGRCGMVFRLKMPWSVTSWPGISDLLTRFKMSPEDSRHYMVVRPGKLLELADLGKSTWGKSFGTFLRIIHSLLPIPDLPRRTREDKSLLELSAEYDMAGTIRYAQEHNFPTSRIPGYYEGYSPRHPTAASTVTAPESSPMTESVKEAASAFERSFPVRAVPAASTTDSGRDQQHSTPAPDGEYYYRSVQRFPLTRTFPYLSQFSIIQLRAPARSSAPHAKPSALLPTCASFARVSETPGIRPMMIHL